MPSADPHKQAADAVRAATAAAPAAPAPTAKPLLLVDIDGVISLFGGRLAGRAGSFHSIDGMPHFLSADAAAHLLDLAEEFDLVWCSGWEEKADEHLPHLLGLPRGLPHLRFERAVGRSNAHWKLAAIDSYARERALAWIDDALSEDCHEWAAARAAPTLLVQTAPADGLTTRERDALLAWAREQAATSACAPQGSRGPATRLPQA